MEARKTELSILYEGKNISKDIVAYIERFTYTDCASGESDSISITVSNIDKKWISEWMPNHLDKIQASIIRTENGAKNKLECGTFFLDDLSFSASPLTGTIGAVSKPISDEFSNRKKTKTWKGISVFEIAKEVTGSANLTLPVFDAKNVNIEELEQSNETDCSFLSNLCQSYGLAMKLYNNKIVIFEEEQYENKKEVGTIKESDMQSWDYSKSIQGTYTGAVISYTDPKNSETYHIKVGGGDRILEINEKADNTEDAEKKALAKLKAENRKMTSLKVALKIPQKFVATSSVLITGLGKIDGKYFIDKVKHDIANGYKMTLEMHQIDIKTQSNVPAKQEGRIYTVVGGDSLWAISKRFYGIGASYMTIYNANKSVIEQAAINHGKRNSDNGHFIWSGTQLIIP